ncbi:MAG: mechanosensitive ion channel family protein [Prolixibacteraceae bacterium]
MKYSQKKRWNDPADKSDFKKRKVQNRKKYRAKKHTVVKGAESRLKKFRQSTILAVAVTGFILLLFTGNELSSTEQTDTSNTDTTEILTPASDAPVTDSEKAADEAIGVLHNMWNNFTVNYPKILIAIACLILAWLLTRLIKFVLRRSLKRLKSIEGIIVLTSIVIWALAIGVVFSIVAGDIRAVIGSFGLIGLALSWALQTPIESFTGWLLNTFRRYYKVGDRIQVGDVFGDVYMIDFLSTTVWEIGSPYQPGFVSAEQPTGRLVTFPNNEILTGTVINLTGDFPFVWDELNIAVANESDIPLAMEVLENTATQIIGNYMSEPARRYSTILKKAGLHEEVPEKPQVFVAASDSWTNIIIRYLAGAGERRKWKTELLLKISHEINKPEYRNKIIPVYSRQQIQFIDADGIPINQMESGSS